VGLETLILLPTMATAQQIPGLQDTPFDGSNSHDNNDITSFSEQLRMNSEFKESGFSDVRSYETAVGPTFEVEARIVLGSIIREICPWFTNHSEILSRKLDQDDNPREGDLMCYLEGDSLGPCISLANHGVRVLQSESSITELRP
jgi:hypothetical protein